MKPNSLQIDISTLPEEQKRKCLQLLAQSNVNFSQKNNKFLAQIKINGQPDISKKIFATKQSQRIDKIEKLNTSDKKQQKSIPFPTKQADIVSSAKPSKQSKVKQLSFRTYQTQTKENIGTPIPKGKKPINRVIKSEKFNIIQITYPFVQLYIYPKKMTIQAIGQIIQYIYQDFWRQNKQLKAKNALPCFPAWLMNRLLTKFRQRVKFEQHLVNLLDSVYYHSFKNTGIKIFLKFLTEQYTSDCLSYFLVIRQLIKEVLNEHNIQRNILKLKQNKYQKQIEQMSVKELLKICSQSAVNLQEQFQNLTKIMYYNEQKRKNYIQMFQMAEHLIESFNKLHTHQYNLQLSYSQNDSTLNQLLFNSQGNPIQIISSKDEELQNNFILDLCSKTEEQKEQQQCRERRQFKQKTKELIDSKMQKLCQQTECQKQDAKKIVNALFDSIVQSNKQIWFDYLGKRPSQSELLYIENLQEKYNLYKKETIFVAQFTTKFYMMPGIRQFFAKKFIF